MMGMWVVGIREIARCWRERKRLNEAFSSLFTLNTFLHLLFGFFVYIHLFSKSVKLVYVVLVYLFSSMIKYE